MTLARRLDTRGVGMAHQGEIEAAAAYVDTTIEEIARRSTDDERAGMAEWWACCRKMVGTAPAMAKFLPDFCRAIWICDAYK